MQLIMQMDEVLIFPSLKWYFELPIVEHLRILILRMSEKSGLEQAIAKDAKGNRLAGKELKPQRSHVVDLMSNFKDI